MVHIQPDFKTKKEFLEALKNGRIIKAFNPFGLYPLKGNGWGVIEAPSERHKWYLAVEWNEHCVITKVRK